MATSRLNVPNLTIADHVNYGVHFGHDGVPIRAILVPSGSRNLERYRCSGYYGIGLVQPNSRIDAAMLATCSRLFVRGLVILGISRSTTREFSRVEGTLVYVAWIVPMAGTKIVGQPIIEEGS